MKKTLLFFILFTSLFSAKLHAQQDTEFWFTLPYFAGGAGSAWHGWEDRRLCIVTLDKEAQVSILKPAIDDPADPYYFEPIVVNVPANSHYVVDLNRWIGALMMEQGKIRPFAIQILSTANIYVYFANFGSNYDIYSLKGKNALGNDFWVPQQYKYDTRASWETGDNCRASVEILAVDDNTDIIIQTRVATNLGPAGTYTITLNRGYAYSLVADSPTGAGHLHNTRITTKDSNKRIAVNTTDDSMKWSGMDLIGEQIVPTNLLGDRYVAIKNYSPGNDNGIELEQVYIFPTEDNTVVTINGQVFPAMNVGDKLDFDLKNDATLITSSINKPVVVFQVSGYKKTPVTAQDDLEAGGTLLPKLDCTGSVEVAFRTSIGTGDGSSPIPLFNVVTKKEYIDAFTVNDDPNIIKASDFKPVPGTGDEFYWCRHQFPAGTFDVLRIKNVEGGLFQLAVRDAYDSSCAFTYFSDYYFANIKPRLSEDFYIEGDRLHLFLHDAGAYNDITWIAPDGTEYKDSGSGVIIEPVTMSDAGIYRVGAELKDLCNDLDTAEVAVSVYEDPSKNNQYVDICSGMVETLTPPAGYAPYVWLQGNDTLSTDKELLVSPDTTTVYGVENRKRGIGIPFNGNFQRVTVDFTSDYLRVAPNKGALNAPGSFILWRRADDVHDDLGRVYDHTPGITNRAQNGAYLIANCRGEAGNQVWTKTVDVNINTKYELSAWFITPKQNGTQAQLEIRINDVLIKDLMDENGDFYPDSVIIPRNDGNGTNPSHWGLVKGLWDSNLRTTATISIRTAASNPDGACVGIDDITFSPLFPIVDTVHVEVYKTPEPKIIASSDMLCQGKSRLNAGDNDSEPYDLVSWYKVGNDDLLSNEVEYTAIEAGNYVLEVMSQDGCVARDTMQVNPGIEIKVDVEDMPEVCSEEPYYVIDYTMEDDELGAFHIKYDELAKAAGFEDLFDQPVVNNELQVPLPAIIPPGIYNAEIEVFGADSCSGSQKSPVRISIKYNARNLMAQKWNDVLVLFNFNYTPDNMNFIDYQWYKNGEPLEGETYSYLYVPNGTLDMNAVYSARLTQDDGTVFYTCDFTPELRSESQSIPTMVEQNQTISLNDFATGNAIFYDVNGLLYSQKEYSIQQPEIEAPAKSGFYILYISMGSETHQYKIFVH